MIAGQPALMLLASLCHESAMCAMQNRVGGGKPKMRDYFGEQPLQRSLRHRTCQLAGQDQISYVWQDHSRQQFKQGIKRNT